MSPEGVTLAYGHQQLPLPDVLLDRPLLRAPGLRGATDPEGVWRVVTEAAARTLAPRVGPTGRLALVVPDRTRPLLLPSLLPPLIGALAGEGIQPARVTIVPASGMHRPMTRAELGAWIGVGAACSAVSLAPHDADADAAFLGTTASGIPVAGHPVVARASAALLLGRIVFHYLAGFGGGRKMLVPGIAARRTILAVHSRCLSLVQGAGRHPRAIAGLLEGNPVHEAAVEAARLFPPSFALHVQLAADGALAEATFGDPFEDFARAAERYGQAFAVDVEQPFDAVIVSAGGHPTDRDLVQAHKALDAVAPMVRDGGTVVLVAACADGVGNTEVLEGLRLGSPEAIERSLRTEFRVGVHTALALRAKTTRLRVLALTELPDDVLRLAGIGRVASLEEAARAVLDPHEPTARIALAPRGASLLYKTASPTP